MDPRSSVLPARCGGLVNKIHAGECVLVLGPRVAMPAAICPDGRTPIDDYLCQKLVEELGDDGNGSSSLRAVLTRSEEKAGASTLRSVFQGLVGELDQHTTDLHRDLASLPIRLVLLATPDRMMFNAFREVGKTEVREAYYDYCTKSGADVPLSLPSSDKPIVYSLFGRHDHPESMVLTDKNLLEYLVQLTKESPPLPDSVRATLRAPSTLFLFVGFGFAYWWLRLLLKVLQVTGVENRLLSLALEDTNTLSLTTTLENKGFFESAGIYIQAGDWSALAKELAARYRADVSRGVASSIPPAPSATSDRRPLVFLSFASEDRDRVTALARDLQERGVSVWQDSQNLRAGQNWEERIPECIKRVDYFVFVQTENMDRRDAEGVDGVYNRELKLALARVADKPYGAVFIFHVVVGQCRIRPEPELAPIQRFPLDTSGVDALATLIRESFASTPEMAVSNRVSHAA
jgi:hypothetical protein